MRTAKPKAPRKSRKPRISVPAHAFPALDKPTWLFVGHEERTRMTLSYIQAFDRMNNLKPGNSYTFGGVAP